MMTIFNVKDKDFSNPDLCKQLQALGEKFYIPTHAGHLLPIDKDIASVARYLKRLKLAKNYEAGNEHGTLYWHKDIKTFMFRAAGETVEQPITRNRAGARPSKDARIKAHPLLGSLLAVIQASEA